MRMIFRVPGTWARFLPAVIFIASSYGTLLARPVPHNQKGASPQTFLRQKNTKSNADFFYTNRGVLFNSGQGAAEGLFWPRGDTNSYIFGAGLWFATRKISQLSIITSDGWSVAGSIPNPAVTGFIANSSTKRLFVAEGYSIYMRQDTGFSFQTLTTFGTNVTALAQLPSGDLLIGTSSGLFVGTETGPWPKTSITAAVSAISSFGVVSAGSNIYTLGSDGASSLPPRSLTGAKVLRRRRALRVVHQPNPRRIGGGEPAARGGRRHGAALCRRRGSGSSRSRHRRLLERLPRLGLTLRFT